MSVNMHYDYADRKNGRSGQLLPRRRRGSARRHLRTDDLSRERHARRQKFAGYSLAEADNLRKAMGKKSREVMADARARSRRGLNVWVMGRCSASNCST
jgi:DNA polymerase-3 subunit alpha